MDVFFLPVRREGIDRAGWRRACPRALIPDIGPDPALLHAHAQPLVALRPVQQPDQCIIGMQQVAGHDIRLDPFERRLEPPFMARPHQSTSVLSGGISAPPMRAKILCWR